MDRVNEIGVYICIALIAGVVSAQDGLVNNSHDNTFLLKASQHEQMPVDTELANTYWKLMEVGGMEANLAVNEREPHLVLDEEKSQVSGFTGCNRFFGSFQSSGKNISFSRMGLTRMACLHGMEQEGLYMRALEMAASWQVAGDELSLLDQEGRPVARFKARSMNTPSGM